MTSRGGHFHRKKSACGKLDSSNRACQILGGHFTPKASAASWIAATGLVKSWVDIFTDWIAAAGLVKSRVVIFTGKKAPAARHLSATGLVKSRGGHFHKKKSACGKLDSSNRACQVHWWPLESNMNTNTPNRSPTEPNISYHGW